MTKKIFVLGLSRTGTTSLHAALVLLGLSSIHYPAAAAKCWLAGRFEEDVLKDYDACLDLPTPIYYPQLDRLYPGSKFILTERPIEPWLDSVSRQWKAAGPPGPKTVLRDMVRASVYGTILFNANRLKTVWMQHSKNVKSYFHGRESDFMTFNVSEGDGWDKLCQFLGKNKPADISDFPRLRTPYIGPLASVKTEEIHTQRQAILTLIKGESKQQFKEIPTAN